MITIEPADYWLLRTRAADVIAATAAVEVAQARLDVARDKQRHAFAAVAPKYNLDGKARYRFDDDRCALITDGADAPPNGGT